MNWCWIGESISHYLIQCWSISILPCVTTRPQWVNTLRQRQNGRHFADNIFKCSFLNENVWIPFKISLKFVPKDPINNIPALVQIMAWRRPGDKPLSEPLMVSLTTNICITRPQWVNLTWDLKWPIINMHQASKSCWSQTSRPKIKCLSTKSSTPFLQKSSGTNCSKFSMQNP